MFTKEAQLFERHFQKEWIERIDGNRWYIKSEFQVLCNQSVSRSQHFIPKAPVEIWAQGKPIPEELKCKVEYIEFDEVNNKIWFVDTTNRVSPRIHVI